jgi:hypothetical protein
MKMAYPLLLATILAAACQTKDVATPQQSLFDSIPTAKPVTPQLEEASGIADSKTVPRTLWVQEDSGNPPQLFSITHDGTLRKKVFIKGAVNRDWEDLALVNGDLYVADIGDNNKVFTEYMIYKFHEPDATTDTITNVETIRFKYEDGAHDAEAFLVDPGTKDILIITKRDNPSGVYKITFPYATTGLNTAVKTGELTYGGVVSAALSPDGKEILVKTYTALYSYTRVAQPLDAALQSTAATLPYTPEPQGEAVTFAQDNSGFFTLSEKGFAGSVKLYFYKRR